MFSRPQELAVRRGPDATLSVVVPLFNEADNVDELLRRIRAVIAGLTVAPAAYEVILVDDGSRDATLEKLFDAAHGDPRLRVISLSRNFGHQIAATAGLDAARGDAVVLMDGDLQDPPELIDDFLAKFREGYDVVYATRRRRHGESRFKLFTAALFYRTIRRLTNVSIPVDTGDFRLMSRRVVAALRDSRERHRFIRGLVSWVGYKQT
ncbi:MAG: putative glycosyltransferase, partial [Candidatus Eremiobacteraeota bacterium]|nr:putative glycosyltransferase [Candidatus Eremiobacteraeota bacterium]